MLVRTPGARGSRPSGPVLLNRELASELGLVALWSPSGVGRLRDIVGAQHSPTTISGYTPTPFGMWAIEFLGGSAFIDIGDVSAAPISMASTYTIAAWVYPYSSGTNEDTQTVFSNSAGGVPYGPYFSTGGDTAHIYEGYPGGNRWLHASRADVLPNRWSLIAASYDGITHRLHTHGVPNGSDANTAYGWANSTYIGRRVDGAGPAPSFNGLIGDVMLAKRAWSDGQQWRMFDPATRWDLYWQRRRTFFIPAGGGGSFNPAWAAGSNVILGATPC